MSPFFIVMEILLSILFLKILSIFAVNLNPFRMKTFNLLICVCFSASLFGQSLEFDAAAFVNPFAGTQRMGHVFPGATAPFGMVQLSPDTDSIFMFHEGAYNPKVYEYCAGYQYDDSTICGFSHTHLSGTGHSDLGDFLIMPTTGKLQLNPGTAAEPEKGYRSRFSHKNEQAQPGYYQVFLDDYQINAELTATSRVGVHSYTFPKNAEAHIILDLRSGIYNYEGKTVWTFLRLENDTLLTGYRQTYGWARTRTVYFALSFSKPIVDYGFNRKENPAYNGFYRKFEEEHHFPEMAGKEIVAWFDFDLSDDQNIMCKMALSSVSTDGAIKNLIAETPSWNFYEIRQQTYNQWQEELEKIQVEMMAEEQLYVFYTALYHAFLSPVEFMDVDGQYRGLDQNIHQANGFTNYSTFSLWDTYRALHPLFNLVQPDRNNDMVHSMLAHYDQSVHHMLPIWSHYANENWCMIGYHSVPVIADAIVHGNFTGDKQHALEACVQTASYRPYDGLSYYIDKGYVPEDKNGSSVSKTLEYAYDDYTIAQIAERLGKDSLYHVFWERSGNYQNVYDSSIGFMRPRLNNGQFREKFDPMDTHGQGFIEGNAWNYGLYVPQNPKQMIEMMGGKNRFVQKMDSLFTMHISDEHIAHNEDITRDGIIGNYVHGNEPGHHIPYLYNYADHPSGTQEKVRLILDRMYRNSPDGLCGNDDCGQMSAWYIFSSLGFYPFCPGSGEYAIGSPLVKSAQIQLADGKILNIQVKNQSPENIYVKEVSLNGKKVENWILKSSDLMQGGELVFKMSNRKAD